MGPRAIVRRPLLVASAVAALSACTSLPSDRGGDSPGACEILPSPDVAADSITAAAIGQENRRRLHRMIYRETPCNVDCEGRVVPGLAESWRREDGGHRWLFEMPDDARRLDGAPMTARVFEDSWRRDLNGPWGRPGTDIDSVVVVEEHKFRVYFTRPQSDAARLLSDASFAYGVARNSPHCGLLTARPETARDLLEVAVDLMLAADPEVVAYAETRPEFATVALPWSRTYVLLSTTRAAALENGDPIRDVDPVLQDALARDAVRGDARGALSPFWWDDLDDCEEVSSWIPWLPPDPAGANTRAPKRVLYDVSDPVARGLAGRVVALAAVDPRSPPEAAALSSAVPGLGDDHGEVFALGVEPKTLDDSIRRGDDFAYIVALPRRVADACLEIRRLLYRAHWLAVDGDIASAIVPLVDTRDYVIARRDRFGLTVDWYGNIRITR